MALTVPCIGLPIDASQHLRLNCRTVGVDQHGRLAASMDERTRRGAVIAGDWRKHGEEREGTQHPELPCVYDQESYELCMIRNLMSYVSSRGSLIYSTYDKPPGGCKTGTYWAYLTYSRQCTLRTLPRAAVFGFGHLSAHIVNAAFLYRD